MLLVEKKVFYKLQIAEGWAWRLKPQPQTGASQSKERTKNTNARKNKIHQISLWHTDERLWINVPYYQYFPPK